MNDMALVGVPVKTNYHQFDMTAYENASQDSPSFRRRIFLFLGMVLVWDVPSCFLFRNADVAIVLESLQVGHPDLFI